MMVGVVLLTLTFDSSPIKGEGYMVGVVLFTLPPLWIADQVRNDGSGVLVGVILFTLTFDSSPNQGRGDIGGFDV